MAGLPDRWGFADRYLDVAGTERVVDPSTLRRLREVIGEPASDQAPIILLPGQRSVGQRGDMHRDGTVLPIDGTLPSTCRSAITTLSFPMARLPGIASPDVATSLHVGEHGGDRPSFMPPVCRELGDRDFATWPVGEIVGGVGTSLCSCEPRGRGHPGRAATAQPFFPASRRFRNPIYIRVRDSGADAIGPIIAEAAGAGQALNRERIIDRDTVWRLNEKLLRLSGRLAHHCCVVRGLIPGSLLPWLSSPFGRH